MEIILKLLADVYGANELPSLEEGITNLWEKYANIKNETTLLSEKDVVLISYGDQVYRKGEARLKTLNNLLITRLKDEISIVHILPFYPSCSDDGFSVIDYYKVDEELGSWEDIKALSENFKLLFDAVINHTSQHCAWFKKFMKNDQEYREFYIEVNDLSEYSKVVRPRTSPLIHEFKLCGESKSVWTTFSEDQVDLNYKNPYVFLKILDLLLFYLSKGAQIIRLDAIGFLWKEKNTTCIHLPQTHSLIKIMRKVIEKVSPSAMLLSETNVPHEENISYFGNGDEAHMIYNFTLPPLLAYSILSGSTQKLNEWAKTLELPYPNICYFNFLASHDGIGIRPVDKILQDDEINLLIESARANGGQVSYKSNPDGEQSPYEINCNYFSLLKGKEIDEELGIKRMVLAHAILLTMPGLPAIYFHSMFGSENDIDGMLRSNINRRINREKVAYSKLNSFLNDINSKQSRVLTYLKMLIRIRKTNKAFNPYSSFEIESSGNGIFNLRRISNDGQNIVNGIFNLSTENVTIPLDYSESKKDIISKKTYKNSVSLNPLEFVWLKII